jgi:beta-glucuronidase
MVKDLSGFWKVAFDFAEKGDAHYLQGALLPDDARPIAVPASFNDQFCEKKIRDFVGNAYYYLPLRVPAGNRISYLRFGSVNYSAVVFLNGEKIGEHSGGHLSFSVLIPKKFNGQDVLLAVRVNNELTWQTIPPGTRSDYRKEVEGIDKKVVKYFFDFYHYCGINRRVHLVTCGPTFLSDLTVKTASINRKEASAQLSFSLAIEGEYTSIHIRVVGKNGKVVGEKKDAGISGVIDVRAVEFWGVHQGHLYDFHVEIFNGAGTLLDHHVERIGIRTVEVKGLQFLLNGEPVYFTGFGRHEDFIITGRNIPDAVLLKDFELMRWMNANSFRTAHYPYSDEHLQLADEFGFLVIDEAPATGINNWTPQEKMFTPDKINDATRDAHTQQVLEMIRRDKNRACVVMWSLANEAVTFEPESEAYFRHILEAAREQDKSRPFTAFLPTTSHLDKPNEINDHTAHLFDVIALNRYYAWYIPPREGMEAIPYMLEKELTAFYRKYGKPIFMGEFGADCLAGLHSVPEIMWSEEYQKRLFEEYFKVIDRLDFMIGEHVWNFADFMTKEGIERVMGNRKGVFTRERQPKASAFLLKDRWTAMGSRGENRKKTTGGIS